MATHFSKTLGYGYNFVKAIVHVNRPELTICSPSYHDENGFKPAETVDISGELSIKELRDFCDEVLKATEKENTKIK